MKKHVPALALAFVIAFAWMHLAAQAQQAAKMPRLGWLQTAPSGNPFYQSFL
jgi:hypothetical protein